MEIERDGEVLWEVVDGEIGLRKAFDSCARVFPEAELDPWNWWLDEFRSTLVGTHSAPFHCLTLRLRESVIGGATWNLYDFGDFVVSAIGFVWIEESGGLRGQGLGRSTYMEAMRIARAVAESKGKVLAFSLLESNVADPSRGIVDSRDFWIKLGYVSVGCSGYILPCLRYDSESGISLEGDVKLEVMVSSISWPVVHAATISRVISTIYSDWYEPRPEEFANRAAYEKAYGSFLTKKEQSISGVTDVGLAHNVHSI